MAIVGFSTHTAFGSAAGTQAFATNTPTISADPIRSGDVYSFVITNPDTLIATEYIRIMSRASTTGIAAAFAADELWFHVWFRAGAAPNKVYQLVHLGNPTQLFSAINITTANKLTFSDFDDYDTAAATASGANNFVLVENTVYCLRGHVVQSTGQVDVALLSSAGVELETITIASGANLDEATGDIAHIWIGSPTNTWNDGTGNAPTITMEIGEILVSNSGYPDFNARIIHDVGTVAGATTANFTANTGTNVSATSVVPPDDSTTYSASSTNGAILLNKTFLFTNRSGAILCYSPYWIGWESGAATTSVSCRFIENGTTTTLTGSDPGTSVGFHLRGPLETTMRSDGSVITFAKLRLTEVGCILNSISANEFRCGSIGMHVVYIPNSADGTGGSGSKLNLLLL